MQRSALLALFILVPAQLVNASDSVTSGQTRIVDAGAISMQRDISRALLLATMSPRLSNSSSRRVVSIETPMPTGLVFRIVGAPFQSVSIVLAERYFTVGTSVASSTPLGLKSASTAPENWRLLLQSGTLDMNGGISLPMPQSESLHAYAYPDDTQSLLQITAQYN